jgi:hypothetical protein
MISEQLKKDAEGFIKNVESEAYAKAKEAFDKQVSDIIAQHDKEIVLERDRSYNEGFEDGKNSQVETPEIFPPVTFADGTEYLADETRLVTSFTYSRVFKATTWGTIILPVSLHYSDWSSKFEIAEIVGVEVNNGKIYAKRNVLGVGSQTLPNTPYLIRAKLTSNTPQAITKKNCLMFPAEEGKVVIQYKGKTYTFKGSYLTMTSEDLAGKYYSSGGYFKEATSILKPMRVYLEIE